VGSREILKYLINSILESAFDLRLTRSVGWNIGDLPKTVWGTKGFEFWTLLSLLLRESRCSRILELGSGRSTVTFAEYAKSSNSHFVSLETSPEWFEKWGFELRFLNLGLIENPVHLVTTDFATGWYDLESFRKVTGNGMIFDFVLIDGPNDVSGNSKGIRDSEIAVEAIRTCAAKADVIIVDDVHRRHVFGTLDRFIDSEQYDMRFYDYYHTGASYANSLCISIRKASLADMAMSGIAKVLAVPLYRGFHGQRCSED